MGWGICFALDDNYVLYCADGCKWKAKVSDMPRPSGCQVILDYFENQLHRELDMIRDECPGTAAALTAACEENFPEAVSAYEDLPDEEKEEMSKDLIKQFTTEIQGLQELVKENVEKYNTCKKAFNSYKPPAKPPKYRMEELNVQMEPLRLEFEMEKCADSVEKFKKRLATVKKLLKREKTL